MVQRLPVGSGVWLVRDRTVGVPAGLIVERLAPDGVVYDVVELFGADPWFSYGHPTSEAAVAELAAFFADHGL